MPSQKRTSKQPKKAQALQKKPRTSIQDDSQRPKPKGPIILSSSSDSSDSSSSDSSSDESSSAGSQVSPRTTPPEPAPEKRKHIVKSKHVVKRRIDPMDKIGRWAVCSISAFLNIPAIDADKFESLNDNYEPDDMDQSFLKAWDQLVVLAPALKELLKNADTEKGQIKYSDALNKISCSVLSARQYHTSIIRRDIIDWMTFEDNDPPLAKLPKSLRGVNHPATRRLIVPQRYFDKLNDPEFLEKLRNGTVAIRATDWPAFLYDQWQVDKENIEIGLFTGELLFSVFYAIFFGIGSATSGDYRKNLIAARNGMRKVTGRNIAYAAIQARFALSAIEKWNIEDAHFDYQVFYNEIVDFFEEFPEDEQAVWTLEYWNKCVFNHKDGLAGLETAGSTRSEDEYLSDIAASTTIIARKARKERNAKTPATGSG
ncbi:hypothetical protein F5878DRAFT_665856 [Lentinula raphanica]|uniref:Uncharacterized protein n=1 Tax=Lentinula raphanica TaxID=153919 RepID=A0AA38NYW3_9AGAR|nr:hypothetical protein F5878DRAFT_665856 [Lentinula raphanica]